MDLSKIKKSILFIFLFFVIIIFFKPFLLQGKLPIPADTIVGMYHPWRDVVWDGFTAGIPFKNFLITDPVRQQFLWRRLGVSLVKQGELPLWNPYTHAGTPLLANLQSAVFYPLNILFLLLPFNLAWGVLIFLQPLLGGIFLYVYLRHFKLREIACFLGALTFSFSGFFIAWLEWGTVLHVGLWLPLILLSIDKIFQNKKLTRWSFILVFSLTSSFFAGHLQTSFYLVLFSLIYLAWRLSQIKNNRLRLLSLFLISYSLFLLITAIQWLPTWQFIKLSARGVDQIDWQQLGWFIPWQNLVQFLAPDFFGNPTTLNYWGIFNYAEFIGYIGVIPLIFALYAILWRRDRKTLFFATFSLVALSFALPTPWAKLPYQLGLPLVSTSQPTRLLFVVDFCLAVLAALGIDALLRKKASLKKMIATLAPFFLLYGILWLFVLGAGRIWPEASWVANLGVSKRNLILPTGFLLAGVVLISSLSFKKIPRKIILFPILALICFDLLRFGWKFTPFTKKEWIFPETRTIEFLKEDKEVFRFMSTDRRLFPPNFTLAYKLQSVDGYDPLYLLRYGELIAASERGKPDILPPFGFNRIITPQNYQSPIVDLLNVKYVLSLKEEDSAKLVKVFQEGQTRVYENKNVFPRAFMVYDYQLANGQQEVIELMMADKINLSKTVILEDFPEEIHLTKGENEVKITSYQENRVVIRVESDQLGFLVLTDAYFPGWQARVDGEKTEIYRANYYFRAIIVPKGSHEVVFNYDL